MLGAPPPLISSASVFHRYPSCCSPVFLMPAAHHQRDRVIRQRLGLVPWRAHPHVPVLRRRTDHQHGLRMRSARRSRSATSFGAPAAEVRGGGDPGNQDPARACDAYRMTTFGAVSIVWRMFITSILTGYRPFLLHFADTGNLLSTCQRPQVLFLVERSRLHATR